MIDRFIINISSAQPFKDSFTGIFTSASLDISAKILCHSDDCGAINNMVTEATVEPDSTYGPTEENFDLLIALPILVTFTAVVTIVLSGLLIFSRLRSKKMTAAASSDAAHGRGEDVQFGFATGITVATDNCSEYQEAVGIHDYASLEDGSNDEYNHENPYWVPADQETELLSQLKMLRILSVAQNELE